MKLNQDSTNQADSTNQFRSTNQAKRRINIIKGQLDGLMRMIENNEYCIDLLTQSSAIQQSLKSLDVVILERHLTTHVRTQFETQPERAVKELLKVFRKSFKNK
jgi:DNA-binding FrmR family transcriptional regulator